MRKESYATIIAFMLSIGFAWWSDHLFAISYGVGLFAGCLAFAAAALLLVAIGCLAALAALD